MNLTSIKVAKRWIAIFKAFKVNCSLILSPMIWEISQIFTLESKKKNKQTKKRCADLRSKAKDIFFLIRMKVEEIAFI